SLVGIAYAQDLSPELEAAALRRKARYEELSSLEEMGVVGENHAGLVAVRKSSDGSVEELVGAENNDRMIIYKEIAAKNNTSVEEIQKIYAGRHQENAPSGTPIETGAGNWHMK
ncbi:MAG: YdbL family protein, partial [Candidatus Omnitrophica bacterium]|nr:YdbL family protein [Candidatus Omnitrophota bacterium]